MSVKTLETCEITSESLMILVDKAVVMAMVQDDFDELRLVVEVMEALISMAAEASVVVVVEDKMVRHEAFQEAVLVDEEDMGISSGISHH